MKYTPVIGLEVHVELKTNSKMFCSCSADYFGQEPNTHTCPVCLGLPGALPVPNKKAIEWCLMIGKALGCTIPLVSKFDRKNYFYPDLSKGYQISQYDQPFAQKGSIVIPAKAGIQENKIDSRVKPENDTRDGKIIRIRRVHMEEDTGKLVHETINGERVSLIDFNRSGVPLVEIVTEPDFDNAKDVVEYLKKLQQIVRYLNVSNADMEKGEMRLEPNISLRVSSSSTTIEDPSKKDSRLRENDKKSENDRGFELPKYKVEVKNINSFSFVDKAIAYEIKRQAEILDKGEIPAQETRGFVEEGSKTVSQRSKEDAMDYRYFPEPDIPPIVWQESDLDEMFANMPELPDAKRERFVQEFGLSAYNADVLTRERATADFFEECIKICHPELVSGSQKEKNEMPNQVRHDVSITTIANWMINKKIDVTKVLPAEFIKEIIAATHISGINAEELETILKDIISKNEKVVADYKSGKENAIMFLVGQAMRELKGREKADIVKETLKALLA